MTAEDEILVTQLHTGHMDALRVLFERYFRLVFNTAGRILRNREEAEDLVQDVFMEIQRKGGLYDPQRGSVKTWILQYAYHRSFTRRKYLALRGFYDASITAHPAEVRRSCKPNQLEPMENVERRELLQRALQGLNQRERQIIQLIAFDGLTAREASVQMQKPYANVRTHYYRSLKKLKQILEGSTTANYFTSK
jgi:RNA polymerase sigma-70 factor (ECF subfamily)